MTKDLSTENKIKEAARAIFLVKGYEATRTRDIADASGINLALLNYYFRSKKKLFDQIMTESLHTFLGMIFEILNDTESSIREKIQAFVDGYIDLLSSNPHLPLFILSEIRSNPGAFATRLKINERLAKTVFIQQFFAEVQAGTIKLQMNPLHIMINLASMIVFPFVASPLAMEITKMDEDDFAALMEERRQLIPKWIESMLI